MTSNAETLVSRLLERDSPVHAVLLYGAVGAGKVQLAQRLAAGWLSKDPDSPARRSLQRGNNPDLLIIRPMGASANIRKGMIVPADGPIEDVIPLTTFLRTGPILSEKKVVIIEEAHRLSEDAANSLLKPLEEPHEFARLILTSSQIGAVKATIVSRCLAIACALPSVTDLPDVEPEFVGLAEGSPGELARMKRKPEPYRALLRFVEELKSTHPSQALVMTERLREIGEALGKADDLGTRGGNARALELLARLVTRDPAFDPKWTARLVEAHRRIVGNASAGLALDALFTSLFAERVA